MTSDPSEDCAELVPPSPIPEQSSQGGGVGVGTYPGEWVPPADAELLSAPSASAHTKTTVTNDFLIFDSPVVEAVERDGRVPAVTAHCTPQIDSDLALFRTLADRQDFARLTDLCRERLLTARDGATALRWTKDRAIVEALQGRWSASYDLLASVHWLASDVSGLLRGRYEDEFGLVLVEHSRTALALEHFGRARKQFHGVGYLSGQAEVDHNTGRAYAVRGDHMKATEYFRRALDFARATDDYRLEREVIDSILEFGEGAR